MEKSKAGIISLIIVLVVVLGGKTKAGVILTEDITAKNEWKQLGTGWNDRICPKNNMYLSEDTEEYCCKSDDDQCLKSPGFPYVIKECSQ